MLRQHPIYLSLVQFILLARTTQWNKPSFSDSSAKNHISSRSSGGGERQIRAARTQVCEETGDGGLENGELSSIDQKVNDDASWINERERNANVNRELNVKTENEGAGGGGDDLPPGWEMRAAKNGRVYFVDHVNEITTWVSLFVRMILVELFKGCSSNPFGACFFLNRSFLLFRTIVCLFESNERHEGSYIGLAIFFLHKTL